MLPRYKDGKEFELCIDEKSIPAIKSRLIERAGAMQTAYSFTRNEIRNATGYEDLPDGDVVMQPMTLQSSDDAGIEDYENEPTEEIETETEEV